MKHRISVTINEKTLLKAKEHIRQNNAIRNQSHLVEVALDDFLSDNDVQ